MVLVTDKQYSMELALKNGLDVCLKRIEKKFDNVIIIDGQEGSGKSTLGVGVGYYIAYKLGKRFSVDNIFFDAERMLKFAAENEREVIIWDEAALAGLSKQWQSKIQMKLIKILMTARKKNHFWIFIIPSIAELAKYIAVNRSVLLLHVYTRQNLQRGRFVGFNQKAKNYAYSMMKKTRQPYYSKYSIRGSFPNTNHLIDMEAYEKKKDEAILSVFNEQESTSATQTRLLKLQHQVSMLSSYPHEIPVLKLAEHFGVTRQTIWNWQNIPQKHPQILEK